ncbi:MAG: DUF424 domain-containing protein [Candidatus Aenigmatarchaeota archaeon]|nr:MAG: hypothetical protein B6U68_00335 [Candidatus Aenigmarchaeota archaeon ex4484_14]RLI97000.1 MAG: DUF424 domain-containing protein [Candidatus Aenigmarchaeota archaeon]RLJ04156.1 MAG: DUF424 domain-containing protein [Candidatus Aenigmarchaeota archaeon]
MSEMFFHKVFRQGKDVLVAIADEELIGKTLRDDDIEMAIEKSFYGTELVSSEKIIELVKSCTIANIVGERAVKVLLEAGLVDKNGVMKIGDSFHAQIIKII